MAKLEQIVKYDSNIADVIFRYPHLNEVLVDYGLHCGGCAASGFDTMEAGAKLHGLEDDEIAEMVTRMNEVLSHGE